VEIHARCWPLMPAFLHLLSRIGWDTLSKAAVRSNKMDGKGILLSCA